jgi:hypothetical protein
VSGAGENPIETQDVVKKAFFGYFLYKKFPGQKIKKKNLPPANIAQSPVNPRSDRNTAAVDRSVSHFAAPQLAKLPYNAALNGPAISPYRDEKPV